MEKSCCFFGHRDISEAIKPRLTEAITKLTDEIGIEDFYVGNQGGFDSLVLSVLKELAISNPKLRYSIVLAYLPTDHSAVCDENTLYPEGMENVPKRYCIARRNDWMIEHSKYVIKATNHEFVIILSDCSEYEKRILTDIIVAAKQSLRENKSYINKKH